MSNCFSCHKRLGMINNWRDTKHIREYGFEPPNGMSKNDKLCRTCLDVIVNAQVKKIICKECGNEIQPKSSYCPNCKSNVKPQQLDLVAEKIEKFAKSTKSIKIGYYLNIVSIIGSSLMTINGLTTGDTFTLTVGIVFLIISLIQFPKRKKEFDGISKTD